MKINFISFKSVMVIFALIVAMMIGAYPTISSAEERNHNTITVQGSSSITVSPTIAYVNIGVTTFNKDAATAQRENAVKMDDVYKTLTSFGIDKDKIKTVTYNISPRHSYKNNITTLNGYNVTNAIRVTITDLKKVSNVLDMTVKQGINLSNSISFGINDRDRDKLYLQTLAQAVANAKEKALSIAATAGVTISKPINIFEGSSAYFAPSNYRGTDIAKMEIASAPTPISEGDLKVEANVTVIYDY